jgi:hypothetical protein
MTVPTAVGRLRLWSPRGGISKEDEAGLDDDRECPQQSPGEAE